jgi:hypothetical protein
MSCRCWRGIPTRKRPLRCASPDFWSGPWSEQPNGRPAAASKPPAAPAATKRGARHRSIELTNVCAAAVHRVGRSDVPREAEGVEKVQGSRPPR